MLAASEPARSGRPLDEAIRAIPSAWFRPSPAVYWSDLALSASLGWLAFTFGVAASGARQFALLTIAAFSLYRAVLFIHEITHLAKRDLPAFRTIWNALVGVPLLIPSFLYENVHTDHHRQRCYGTPADPEYTPFGRRGPMVIATSAIASLVVPAALAVRFGVLAPLAWIVPAWRQAIDARASALVINHRYVRHAPIDAAGRVQEVGACLVVYASLVLWWTGRLPARVFLAWFLVGAAISAVNAVRTLAAHRYDRDDGEVSMTDQLLDSCTIAPSDTASARVLRRVNDAGRVLLAPVGLRYHALHHWIPSLPYHNLGRAHRLLVSRLSVDAPYRATLAPGVTPILIDLVQRSRTQPPRPSNGPER